MRRLLALIMLTLSLAISSGPAFAVQAADCLMAASTTTISHDDMGCCKPICDQDCATLCPAAVVPSVGKASSPAEPVGPRLAALTPAPLHSTDLSDTDPSPRTIVS